MSQYVLRYSGFARTPAWCHIVVARDTSSGDIAVLVGELDGNPGTSTTNAIEQVAADVAERILDGDSRFALYQYVPRGLPNLEPTFYRITWNGPPGAFAMPTWEVVDPATDPWLRHIAGTVRHEDYSLDHLMRERDLELIDASRDPDALRWAV